MKSNGKLGRLRHNKKEREREGRRESYWVAKKELKKDSELNNQKKESCFQFSLSRR